MGVTAYLTTDLASIPLMWIIPLALYLLSFILAFARSAAGLVRAASLSLPYLIVPLVLVMLAGFVHLLMDSPSSDRVFRRCAWLAMVRWPECGRRRGICRCFTSPSPWAGSWVGIWNALVAPLIFDRVVEYPLALVLACLVAPGFESPLESDELGRHWLRDLLFAGVVFCLTVILATNQAGLGDSVLGVLGVMIASGMGILSCVTARAQAVAVCARGCRGHGGRRPDAGR